MLRYGASGPTGATAASADQAIAQLWNPSTAKRIYVYEVHLFDTSATGLDIPRLRRSTAQGTTSVSYTPGISADFDRMLAPESGAILGLDFSAEPTLEGTASRGIVGGVVPAAIGSGYQWMFARPIAIPESNGLVIVTGSAIAASVMEATFIWEE